MTDTMVAPDRRPPRAGRTGYASSPPHQGQRKPDRPRLPVAGAGASRRWSSAPRRSFPSPDRAGSGAVGCVAGAGQAASAGECAADPPGYRRTAQARSPTAQPAAAWKTASAGLRPAPSLACSTTAV
ncbi:hypothetical protein ACPA9J_36030 [Pseudomonas aeruginosa]